MGAIRKMYERLLAPLFPSPLLLSAAVRMFAARNTFTPPNGPLTFFRHQLNSIEASQWPRKEGDAHNSRLSAKTCSAVSEYLST